MIQITVTLFAWHVVLAQPINNKFCCFLDLSHTISVNLDVIGENGFHIRFHQKKNYLKTEILLM